MEINISLRYHYEFGFGENPIQESLRENARKYPE